MISSGYHSPNIRDKRIVKWSVYAIRILLGLIFLTAGLSKLIEFPGIIGPVWLEERAAEYGMVFFARFVAIFEALIGALLLSRFATLGAVMLVPMQLGILIFTISLGWRGTPWVNTFLLGLNFGLLWYDWHRLKFILIDRDETVRRIPFTRKSPEFDLLWAAGLVVFIAGMLLLNTEVGSVWLIYLALCIFLITPIAAYQRKR